MEFLPAIRAALGLPHTANEHTILAAATDARSAVASHAQEVASIATAAKLDAATNAGAIVVALQSRLAGGQLEEMVALQTRIHELETGKKRREAEVAISSAMRDGKPIPSSSRETFIARHMADPEGTDFWLSTMMSLHSGGIPAGLPPHQSGAGLDHGDMNIISTLGLDPAEFLRTKRANAIA